MTSCDGDDCIYRDMYRKASDDLAALRLEHLAGNVKLLSPRAGDMLVITGVELPRDLDTGEPLDFWAGLRKQVGDEVGLVWFENANAYVDLRPANAVLAAMKPPR